MSSEPTSSSPRIIAFIFARGGSKGVPGKNLRPVAGVSLIGRAIAVAKQCPRIAAVVVSTDDEAIAAEARAHGAEVPFMRPAHLATDTSPELLAWQHAVQAVQEHPTLGPLDYFISLPPTSPLRTAEEVNAVLDALLSSGADLVCTVTEANRHPMFNMLRLDEAGMASVFLPPGKEITRRQDGPKAYDIATVAYAGKAAWIAGARGFWDGQVRAVVVPRERAIDIDTELDLAVADFLARRSSGDSTTSPA